MQVEDSIQRDARAFLRKSEHDRIGFLPVDGIQMVGQGLSANGYSVLEHRHGLAECERAPFHRVGRVDEKRVLSLPLRPQQGDTIGTERS